MFKNVMFFWCYLLNVGSAAATLNGGCRRRTSALQGPFSDLSRSDVEVFSFLSESTTYTGDMDLRDFNLATLFRIMNYSREILIEDDLFNRIEEFLRNILMANPAEEIFNFLERIEGGSNMILSNKGLVKSQVLMEEFRLDNLRELVLRFVSLRFHPIVSQHLW